jgi:hypothetical protein
MAQRGPLVTAVVVVGGLVGLMTANAAGGLVSAGGPAPSPTRVGATQTQQPTETTEPPVETTTPPAKTTTQPPKTAAPPPAAQFPAEAVYAGETADIPLYVAVAVKGEESAAYLCDGKAVESWLKGPAKNGELDLTSKDAVNTLTAKLTGNTIVGTVMLAGQPHDFSIPLAPPPAGLFRGANGETTVGWIVLPSGKQVGVAKTGTRESSAPALGADREGATIGGKFVAAEAVTGATTFG